LLSLAEESVPEPAAPSPELPGHPAYQQILTVFADTGRPLRARDLCQALDLPIVSKNTEKIRSKLKRLVSRDRYERRPVGRTATQTQKPARISRLQCSSLELQLPPAGVVCRVLSDFDGMATSRRAFPPVAPR
jgi:hypothetical protein